MGIILTKVRIENFRSIQFMELSLSPLNVLIGANNCGKSNFLRAINIALGNIETVSVDDIYVGKDELLDRSKCAIIDIMIRPFNDATSTISSNFSNFWHDVFNQNWLNEDDISGDKFISIRTIIEYDKRKNTYILHRKNLNEWGETMTDAISSKAQQFTEDMRYFLSSFYVDAQRDIVDEIRDRESFFSKATSTLSLSSDSAANIERKMQEVNELIVDNIPALSQTAHAIDEIAATIGSKEGSVQLEPIPRRLTDLHKVIDITFQEGNGARLSMAQQGMGTRSWLSFLTLGSYVKSFDNLVKNNNSGNETFTMLTMEEPEAHLHPQAQQQLYSQLCDFLGQKIISTHSQNVVSQASLSELIHFEKINGKTTATRFDETQFSADDLARIKREIVLSRGELLFSKAIVLCEGITEQQALPVYFKARFGLEPSFYGVNFIGVSGHNYKPFLSLIQSFNLNWFLFSDGEGSTIKSVSKAVKETFDAHIDDLPNIVILESGEDYERHLLNNGYAKEIVSAICEYESDPEFIDNYIKKHHGTISGRVVTNAPVCDKCGQRIYADVARNYEGDAGFISALYDCCTTKQAKAKYATLVAQKITSATDPSRIIPPKVAELLRRMESLI